MKNKRFSTDSTVPLSCLLLGAAIWFLWNEWGPKC